MLHFSHIAFPTIEKTGLIPPNQQLESTHVSRRRSSEDRKRPYGAAPGAEARPASATRRKIPARRPRFSPLPKKKQQKMLDDLAGDILTPITDAFKNTLLQNLSQALALVHQASVFDWESLIDSTRDERNPNPMMSLATLANLDNMASERSIGSAAVSA